jgi:hypothetical protein
VSDQHEYGREQPNPVLEGIEIKLLDLSRVALEPGDVLLVRLNSFFTQAQIGLMKLRLSQIFPGHETVFFSADVELSVVRPTPSEVE